MGIEIFKPCLPERLWAEARAVGKPKRCRRKNTGHLLGVEALTWEMGAEPRAAVAVGGPVAQHIMSL